MMNLNDGDLKVTPDAHIYHRKLSSSAHAESVIKIAFNNEKQKHLTDKVVFY